MHTGGNSLMNGLGQQLDAGRSCYMSCAGNNGQHCGGTWALDLYNLTPATGTTPTKRSKRFGRHHVRSHSF